MEIVIKINLGLYPNKTMPETHLTFQRNRYKNVGGVAYTRYLLHVLEVGHKDGMPNTMSPRFLQKGRGGG